MDGHLATVTDLREHEFLIRQLRDPKYWHVNPIGVHHLGPWLGALQLDGSREPDGGWRWVTGEEFLFSTWHSDQASEHSQPNEDRSPHKPQQHIVYVMRSAGDYLNARWGDGGAGDARSYIVEFDSLPVVTTHSRKDPYVSVVIEERSQSQRIGFSIESKGRTPIGGDFNRRYTLFLPPGIYRLKTIDVSGNSSQTTLTDQEIELVQGQRVILNDLGEVDVSS